MRHKLNLSISERSKKRIERLILLTEADSSAEVIKNSLRLYESIINRSLKDEEVLIRDKKTGEISVYNIFEMDENSLGDESLSPVRHTAGPKATGPNFHK